MWKNIYKRRAQLGIHLEKSSLRATFITHQRHDSVIQHFTYDLIEASHQEIVSQLHKLTRALGDQYPVTVVSLAYQQTIWKTMEFGTNITDEEIYGYLRQQPSNFFGGENEIFYCDYQNIPLENKHASKRKVRIIAANKNNIQNLLTMLRSAQLVVRGVEPDVFALSRGARAYLKINLDAILAIFHVTKQGVIFCVSQNNFIIYAETFVSQPGYDFFHACQKALKYYQSMHPQYIINQVLFVGDSAFLNDKSSLHSLLTCPIFFEPNDFLISHGLALWSEEENAN
jgi:Tfp pilus assembly PilM family ATPase